MGAKKPPRVRADALVVDQGLAEDAKAAQSLVMTGRVLATDPKGREAKVDKPGALLRADVRLRLKGKARPFVSRAGGKLAGALDAFGIEPQGWVCADFGLSTGGFTDCLFARGATRVHGVDVAYGVVDWRVRTDPRLVLYERTNARTLEPDAFGERVRLAVSDLSFISLRDVLPAIAGQLADDGEILALVKPQFELPAERVPNGIVTDDADRQAAVDAVVAAAEALGLTKRAQADSEVTGTQGNREIVLWLGRREQAG